MPNGLIIPATLPSKHKVPDKLSAEQYYELLDRDQLPPEDPNFGHDKWGESEGDEELQADITKGMIEKAISQTQKSRGDVPGDIAKYLDLHSRKSEVNWKRELRMVTGNKKVNQRKTILRRDRRSPHLEHIKGRVKDRMFELLIIGDESGSVSDQALITGINESLHICKITQTPVWYVPVDSRAHKPHQLKRNMTKFNRTACGGTYLSPAIDMAREHHINFNALVVVTDGELSSADVGKFAELNLPVFWLIEPTGTVMPEMQVGRMRAFKLVND
jgi:predicted metal-dependent peptidase